MSLTRDREPFIPDERQLASAHMGAARLAPRSSTSLQDVPTHAGPSSAAAAPVHQRASKRAVDIVSAALGLLILAPVFLLAALAVYATDRGPVIFRQVRVGAGGRHFQIVKFRSMRVDAEEVLRSNPQLHRRYVANNCKLESHEDTRLTRIGRLLRSSSIDELPQLWNVLKGDMSLVGPRPVLPWELDQRPGSLRHAYMEARPGITGSWQVAGRSSVDFHQRVWLDASYVHDWTMGLDLRILMRTPAAVISRRGAY